MVNEIVSIKKPLGETSIEELTGVKSNGGDIVLVNLNRVAMNINAGSAEDFVNAVDMCSGIKSAVWNEKGITLALADRYTIIRYEPPIHQMAAMFFEVKRLSNRLWEGNYEPVKFTKKDMLQFLIEVSALCKDPSETKEMAELIRNMRVRESRHESDTISLEEDKTISTTEEKFETNIPKKFILNIPVTPDFIGKFDFEVRVEKREGSDKGNRKIELYCVNALDLQRAAVKHVLDMIPKEIPRIYGELKMTTREHW